MIVNKNSLIALRPIEDMIEGELIHHESNTSFGLSPCGYNVRLKQSLLLPPQGFSLASTIERFTMPMNLVGVVHDKSTNARRGLSVFNSVIDPGFEGWLTLELSNCTNRHIELLAGQGIAHIIFHEVVHPAMYEGKYQNQPNEPVGAK